MKRLLLDTNIYGLIIVDPKRGEIHTIIHSNKELYLYGFEVVRKELRSTKRVAVNMNLRMDLLRLYDDLVTKSYELNSGMETLAEQYYELYKNLGGTFPKSEMMNDFLIIACASLKNLDIVVSNDTKTMFHELAIKAYTSVNKINRLKLPDFIGYEKFKNGITK